MSSLEDSDSPQLKLVNEWSRGFPEKNLDVIGKHLHKDFRRFTYPRSIGQPEQTKDEWLTHFAGVIKFSTGFKQTLHSVIEAPGKVVIHATAEAENSYGISTVRESIYIIHVVTDEDGSLKIKQVDEFTDSKAYLEIIKEAKEKGADKW